jgi:hypothetical protein
MTRSLLAIAICLTFHVSGQNPNSVYYLANPTPGVWEFSELNTSTGVSAVLQTMPFSAINGAASSAIDFQNGYFHFCTTEMIYSMDLSSTLAIQTTYLPLAATAEFMAMEFDVCDSTFIGVVNDPPASISIERYDPVSNSFTPIMSLPNNTYFALGRQAEFDPNTRIYYLQTATDMIGVNVDLGTYAYNVPVVDPPNFNGTGHFAYNCITQQLIGTTVGTNSNGHYGKFICELDPSTGGISIITDLPTPLGLWKPMTGGSTIDLNTGLFYWSGNTDVMVGGDISSGIIAYSHASTTGSLNFIEHNSGCPCGLTTSVSETRGTGHSIFPNPTKGTLFIRDLAQNEPVYVHSLDGKLQHTGSIGANGLLDLGKLEAATYILQTEYFRRLIVIQ